MNINDKVKVKGSSEIGVIKNIYSQRDKIKYGTSSKVLIFEVEFESGKTMEYLTNEIMQTN